MRDVIVKGYDGATRLDALVLRRIRNEYTMGRRVRELHEHFTVALLDKRCLGERPVDALSPKADIGQDEERLALEVIACNQLACSERVIRGK